MIDAIEDATFLYWYVRPSSRYPTLEFRVCDVCLTPRRPPSSPRWSGR